MIASLTEEQLARMPEIREKWRGYGLSCEPADRKRAELGIVEAYRVAGLSAPKIIWCASPMAGLIVRAEALAVTKGKGTKALNEITGKSVKNRVLNRIKVGVRLQIWGEVRSRVWVSVTDNVGEGIEPSLEPTPLSRSKRDVWSSVGERILDRIEDRWGQYGESFKSGLRENRYYGFSRAIFGQHDSDWLSNIDYFRSVLGLQKETADLNGLSMITQSAGWFWPYENVCWICDRTENVHLDDNERIHNLVGPAISFRDGWKIYAAHGVILPEWIIETPAQITPTKIDNQSNAEIRRVMIELFGQTRYLKEGGSQLIGFDTFGRLWKKELRGDEPIVMAEILNSTPERDGSLGVRDAVATFGEDAQVNHDGMMMRLGGVPENLRFKSYFLRVPPNCASPREAVAWTFNKTEAEYDLAVQS